VRDRDRAAEEYDPLVQSAAPGAGVGGPGRPRQRAQNWLFTLAFVALVAGTAAGFVLTQESAQEKAEQRVDQAAERAAVSLERRVNGVLSALGGAAAVVRSDGTVDQDVFNAYALDLVENSELAGLSLTEVAATPGGTRFVLLQVQPSMPNGLAPGDDLTADPVRAAALDAVVRDQESVLTDVVPLISTGQPGFQVFRPLLVRVPGRAPEVRALIAAGLELDDVVDAVARAVVDGREVAVLDGEVLLFGPAFDSRLDLTTRPVEVPGHTWTVVLGPPAPPDMTWTWIVVAFGAAAVLAMAALMFATVRHQRKLARANALLERAEERSRAVQEVAGRLARALSGSDIVTALVAHLPTAIEAQSAVIATVNEGDKLELLGLDPSGSLQREKALEVRGTGSIVEGALLEPVWLSSPFEWRGDVLVDRLAAGGSALALLPLVAEGVVGVLAVSYPRIRIFADDEKDLLQTVGLLSARALARGRQYDAEHDTALAFQRSALPDDLPTVAGLTIAARYRPAAQRATVGGDWYDVLVLDERRVVLVVGDVVGHGMVAAAAMGRLRTAFQAIARLSADPGAMVRAMSNQVDSIPDSFCTTIVCVVVDLEAASISWCRAGHPPPVVVAGGAAHLLDDRGLPPLGVAPDQSPPVHSRALRPGDTIILYTDGVIERRDESIDEGFRRLGIVAADLADLEPEEFSDALVEALVTDVQADDLAILVVRFDGSAAFGTTDVGARITSSA
jgi:serine phosphatase RsbU (regulator of sigma subunit)/CHASE1-domain containing sensor protein